MYKSLKVIALISLVAIAGCRDTESRPESLGDWTDIMIEDEISAYREAIRTLEDEQRRRSL